MIRFTRWVGQERRGSGIFRTAKTLYWALESLSTDFFEQIPTNRRSGVSLELAILESAMRTLWIRLIRFNADGAGEKGPFTVG
jgi:hypothetical protein